MDHQPPAGNGPSPQPHEPWLLAVLASTLDPLIVMDELGTIQLASDSVERVFQWRAEELVGRNVQLLMPEPYRSQHNTYLAHYRATGKTWILGRPRELNAMRRDGTVFPCEVSVSRADLRVGGPSGEPRAILTGIIRDISERNETDRKLRALNRALEEKNRELETIAYNAEKLASVGKLAASIAHEIRNPLTALKVRLFSIQRAVGSSPALDEKFRVVSEEIDRLEGVVRNFLEFSRPPAPKLLPTDVQMLLERTLALFGHRFSETGTELTSAIESGLPPVVADSEQIRQVLMNLLANAHEAVGNRGWVRISASADALAEGKKAVIIRVADSGGGVPLAAQSRLFEPFFSTKPDGTGLGLSISARIAERHGGKLIMEKTGSAGTTFALVLPTRANCDGIG